jgi:uncharacterized membrane protein YbaN (DUF454 family)
MRRALLTGAESNWWVVAFKNPKLHRKLSIHTVFGTTHRFWHNTAPAAQKRKPKAGGEATS